jgi:hypothetical protein
MDAVNINTLNVLWLSRKGLLRFKVTFVLKVFILLVLGFMLYNGFSLSRLQPRLLESGPAERLLVPLFFILNAVLVLFFITLTILTLKLRRSEFGLYRCGGASRRELFSLVLNESLLVALVSFSLLFAIEGTFLYAFRLEIAGLLKVAFTFSFLLSCLTKFILTLLFIFTVLILCYLPLAFFYSFKDPYEIVRY